MDNVAVVLAAERRVRTQWEQAEAALAAQVAAERAAYMRQRAVVREVEWADRRVEKLRIALAEAEEKASNVRGRGAEDVARLAAKANAARAVVEGEEGSMTSILAAALVECNAAEVAAKPDEINRIRGVLDRLREMEREFCHI
jgi:hypothetical protein